MIVCDAQVAPRWAPEGKKTRIATVLPLLKPSGRQAGILTPCVAKVNYQRHPNPAIVRISANSVPLGGTGHLVVHAMHRSATIVQASCPRVFELATLDAPFRADRRPKHRTIPLERSPIGITRRLAVWAHPGLPGMTQVTCPFGCRWVTILAQTGGTSSRGTKCAPSQPSPEGATNYDTETCAVCLAVNRIAGKLIRR